MKQTTKFGLAGLAAAAAVAMRMNGALHALDGGLAVVGVSEDPKLVGFDCADYLHCHVFGRDAVLDTVAENLIHELTNGVRCGGGFVAKAIGVPRPVTRS